MFHNNNDEFYDLSASVSTLGDRFSYFMEAKKSLHSIQQAFCTTSMLLGTTARKVR